MSAVNDDGVLYHLIKMKDRKYMLSNDRQSYAIYRQVDEGCAFAYIHLYWWVKKYKTLIGREFLPGDQLFPRADERIEKLYFGKSMVKGTFMKTINDITWSIKIVPKNTLGDDMGKFNLHCFRRGCAQHCFVTGKSRWPLDVVKWWSGWGIGDEVNTIIRYLLEETSKYESNFTHYLYTFGSDSRLFTSNVSTLEDVSREMQSV